MVNSLAEIETPEPSTANPVQLAIDAVKIADQLYAANHDGLALRKADFADVDAAVDAVLAARQRINGVTYVNTRLTATWDIHGARFDEELLLSGENIYHTAIVTVRSEFTMSKGAQINVLGALRSELRHAADDAEIYIAQMIFIIDDRS